MTGIEGFFGPNWRPPAVPPDRTGQEQAQRPRPVPTPAGASRRPTPIGSLHRICRDECIGARFESWANSRALKTPEVREGQRVRECSLEPGTNEPEKRHTSTGCIRVSSGAHTLCVRLRCSSAPTEASTQGHPDRNPSPSNSRECLGSARVPVDMSLWVAQQVNGGSIRCHESVGGPLGAGVAQG